MRSTYQNFQFFIGSKTSVLNFITIKYSLHYFSETAGYYVKNNNFMFTVLHVTRFHVLQPMPDNQKFISRCFPCNFLLFPFFPSSFPFYSLSLSSNPAKASGSAVSPLSRVWSGAWPRERIFHVFTGWPKMAKFFCTP